MDSSTTVPMSPQTGDGCQAASRLRRLKKTKRKPRGLQTDWFINSRLSGSSRKVTVIKNLIHKHQSERENVTGWDTFPTKPVRMSSNQIHEWRFFICNRTSLVLLWQCTLEKQKKQKKKNLGILQKNIMTKWATRFLTCVESSGHRAPYVIIAKGHVQLRNSLANLKGHENKICDYIKYRSVHLCIVGRYIFDMQTNTR